MIERNKEKVKLMKMVDSNDDEDDENQLNHWIDEFKRMNQLIKLKLTLSNNTYKTR